MDKGLWDWQDEDAQRLRRAGKEALAAWWDRFYEIAPKDGSELRLAADLARELEEPCWEIFFRHWHVQASLYWGGAPIEPLLEQGERLRGLSREPACQGVAQRFCAQDSLACIQADLDPVGYADEVLATGRQLMAEVPPGTDCFYCGHLLAIRALRQLKRRSEAEAIIQKLLDEANPDATKAYLLLLQYALTAFDDADPAGMSTALELALRQREQGDLSLNPDHEWFEQEAKLCHQVLLGELDAAEALLRNEPEKLPSFCVEGIKARLVLARATADAGAWDSSLGYARAAAEAAMGRQAVRYAAEGLLLQAEAAQALGAEAEEAWCARELAEWLPRLRSRDLDERARSVGAAV